MDIDEDIIVREMNEEDAEKLDVLMARSTGIQSIYKSYLEETTCGQCEYVVLFCEGQLAGFGKLDWKSNYEDFDEIGVPEIKGIQILEAYRNKGLANYLIHKLEEKAAVRSAYCGIGVGLADAYKSDQELLAERGYEPDGKGVFYIEPETAQDELEVDDYQALMMIKKVR